MKTDISLEAIEPFVKGITRKEIAIILDSKNSLFNFNTEVGPTSYRNYHWREMLQICLTHGVDPISDYLKKTMDPERLAEYEALIK